MREGAQGVTQTVSPGAPTAGLGRGGPFAPGARPVGAFFLDSTGARAYRHSMRIAHLLGSFAALAALTSAAAAAPEPGSQLIDCSQAGDRVEITVSSHLDPSCVWTRGVRITASDVVLDCQGARLYGPDRQRGVEISAPTDTALSNITVRNCQIEGFLNNVRITREGFRDLAEGVEYENAFSNIVIEDSTLLNSRGVGVFVDGYVTGVTLRRLHVEGSGSSGIYLEHGSKDSVVEDCDIVNNGFGENGPYWQQFELGGLATSGTTAAAARGCRSTARASAPCATTASRATPTAPSSCTRTAAST